MDIAYYKKMEPFWGVWYIDSELGAGSFGHVFRIKREDFGETYYAALKVITIPSDRNEVKNLKSEGMDVDSMSKYYDSFASELVKEFSLMSKLKGHSNIVSYEDHMAVKHDDGIGYDILIRMELLTPLNDFLSKETVSENMVVRLGIDVCKALEICEMNGIIHRDIKPENIFVSDLGSYKLGDFGVSRVASQATQGMSIKGTISYMAPEVFKGQKYNSTVDIYSLGIMLYKLINNNRGPFLPPAPEIIKYADRESAEMRRMSGEKLPDAVNAGPELMRIIRKAAAFNNKERYASASQMKEELEALLSETGRKDTLSKTNRKVKKNKKQDSKETGTVPPNVERTGSEETVYMDIGTAVAAEETVYIKATDSVAEETLYMPQYETEQTVAVSDNGSAGMTSASKPKKRRIWIAVAGVAAICTLVGVAVAMGNGNTKYEEANYEIPTESSTDIQRTESQTVVQNSNNGNNSENFYSNKYYFIKDGVLKAQNIAWETKYSEVVNYLISIAIPYSWGENYSHSLVISISAENDTTFMYFDGSSKKLVGIEYRSRDDYETVYQNAKMEYQMSSKGYFSIINYDNSYCNYYQIFEGNGVITQSLTYSFESDWIAVSDTLWVNGFLLSELSFSDTHRILSLFGSLYYYSDGVQIKVNSSNQLKEDVDGYKYCYFYSKETRTEYKLDFSYSSGIWCLKQIRLESLPNYRNVLERCKAYYGESVSVDEDGVRFVDSSENVHYLVMMNEDFSACVTAY